VFYKNWTIFNLCQKKNYIILNFNYPMVNTFLVIFLNKKVGSIHIQQKKVKGIKINLDFIFNNFPVHCTGLRLVYIKTKEQSSTLH
jgi:hypothetical protein